MTTTPTARLARYELFKRPTTVRDVLEGKPVTRVESLENIVHTIENSEALLFTKNCEIIPLPRKGDPTTRAPYYSPLNAAKRMPLINITPWSHDQQENDGKTHHYHLSYPTECIQGKITPIKLRISAFEHLHQTKPQTRYVGFSWTHLRTDEITVIDFNELMLGLWLFTTCRTSRDIRDKVEVIKSYHAREWRAERKGDTWRARVPSRGKGDPQDLDGRLKYEVIWENVPIPNSAAAFASWRNMKSYHSCPRKRNSFTFRFLTRHAPDAHDIAAACAIAAQSVRQYQAPMIEIYNLLPFGLVTSELVDYWNNLYFRSMKEEKWLDIQGNEHVRTRRLHDPEISALIGERIKEYGHKRNMYIRPGERLTAFHWPRPS